MTALQANRWTIVLALVALLLLVLAQVAAVTA